MNRPLSDPNLPPEEPFYDADTRIFRHNFWRLYAGGFLSNLIFSGIPLWIFTTTIPIRLHPFFIIFVLASIPFSSPLSMIFQPIKINRFGIYGPPMIDFVEWSQMKSARYYWIGLPYIQIPTERRFFGLWLTLGLRDTKGFVRAVEEWAPEGNPLRLLLKKRGF